MRTLNLVCQIRHRTLLATSLIFPLRASTDPKLESTSCTAAPSVCGLCGWSLSLYWIIFIPGHAFRPRIGRISRLSIRRQPNKDEARGYPKSLIEKTLSEVSFAARQSTLKKQTKKTKGKILPFVTAYHPGVKNLKQILMQEWNLIQNQPLLKTIYKTPPIISYKRGKSLKDILVRAKL